MATVTAGFPFYIYIHQKHNKYEHKNILPQRSLKIKICVNFLKWTRREWLLVKRKTVKHQVTDRMNKSESTRYDTFCIKACCNAQDNNK